METSSAHNDEENPKVLKDRYADGSEENQSLLSEDGVDIPTPDVDDIPDYSSSRVSPLFRRLGVMLGIVRKSDGLPLYELRRLRDGGSRSTPIQRKSRKNICSVCLRLSLGVLVVMYVYLIGFALHLLIHECSGLCSILGIMTGKLAIRKDDRFWLDWDQNGNPGEALGHYPTDFTRGVIPVPCHSHNDYWRRIPLFEAIRYGCTSVEADVALFGEELFVGHDLSSLTHNRTFRSLYVDPLVEILDNQNPKTEFGNVSKLGVFDTNPAQTLVLLVDLKTQANTTFWAVQSQISALRDKGYLSYYDGTSVISGAVTVVGTGNTPFDMIVANTTYRDIFFDAPIAEFSKKFPSPSSAMYNNTNSYYASGSMLEAVGFPWLARYTDSQVEKIRDQIQGAQLAGLKTRYWDFPGWPVGLRNYIWGLLFREGMDYLNVDDLKGVTQGTWGTWG